MNSEESNQEINLSDMETNRKIANEPIIAALAASVGVGDVTSSLLLACNDSYNNNSNSNKRAHRQQRKSSSPGPSSSLTTLSRQLTTSTLLQSFGNADSLEQVINSSLIEYDSMINSNHNCSSFDIISYLSAKAVVAAAEADPTAAAKIKSTTSLRYKLKNLFVKKILYRLKQNSLNNLKQNQQQRNHQLVAIETVSGKVKQIYPVLADNKCVIINNNDNNATTTTSSSTNCNNKVIKFIQTRLNLKNNNSNKVS
jgi:hypothetical protein